MIPIYMDSHKHASRASYNWCGTGILPVLVGPAWPSPRAIPRGEIIQDLTMEASAKDDAATA